MTIDLSMISLKKISSLKSDVFLKNYVVYFLGSMVVAGLNYLFHPVLGRLLLPTDFGDLQVFISLLTQAGIILGAFSLVIVNISLNTENIAKRDALIAELRRISFYVIITLATLLIIFISQLKVFLNLNSVYPIIGLVISLVLSVTSNVRSAYLHGRGRFGELSISGGISALGRLLFAVILIYMGVGPVSAIIAIILAQLASLVFLYVRTKDELHLDTKTNSTILEKGFIKKELIYGLLVLCSTGLVSFIYTSDVLIVKHFFDTHTAGVYSGISAVAKIIFFLLAPVGGVLLASVKISNTPKENSSALLKSLVISTILGGTVLIAFFLFYGIIIKLILGQNYVDSAYMLPKVGVIMFLSSLVNVLVYYFLALRRFFLVGLSIIGVFIISLLLILNHSSINSILNDLIISISILIFIFFIFYAKNYFHSHSRI
jgi:O-antigen/teichoic acid export membrane protein